jgi:hypothetical protein
MTEILPQHTKVLWQWVDILSCNEFSLVFPFGGVAVNMNVATRAYHDYKDLGICFILQISDCEGGKLCLMEPGLMIELRNGDGIAFPSNRSPTSILTSRVNVHHWSIIVTKLV